MTEAMLFLQKTILLSYDPRPFVGAFDFYTSFRPRVAHGTEQQRGDKAGQRAGEHRHEQQKRQVSERRGRAEREHRGGDLSAVVRRRAADGYDLVTG